MRTGRSLANTDSHCQPDFEAYSNADAHTYSYGHGNSDCDSNRYCDGDANSSSYAYAVTDASGITYTKNSPDPEESAHVPAAPVARLNA